MSSLVIAGLVFGCALVAALAAMRFARLLPEHHFSTDSRDVVKLGLGVIATLTALVLGLLVASSKATYDAQDGAVKQMAADFSLLDRYLALYGPEAAEARELLRQVVSLTRDRLWPEAGARPGDLRPGPAREEGDLFFTRLAELQPKTDAQRAVKARALDLAAQLAQTRYRMATQKDGSVPSPFLVVLGLWLVALFAGYGLLAPRNTTVLVVLVVCALSVSAALFLILELGRPFDGFIRVHSTPLQALTPAGS
jgi:hypothetical protein